jgi:hypothetical protein
MLVIVTVTLDSGCLLSDTASDEVDVPSPMTYDL